MAEESILKTKFRQGYKALFYQQWPPLTGGVLLGLFSILIVAWSRPWGIVGGIRNWADWLFYGLGFFPERPENALLYSSSIMDIGFLLGAFGAALLAKEFALRKAPVLEIIKGLAGGVFMGIGSALAMGCNVGAFYSPLINLSASGFPMLVGLTLGGFIGLKYLLWELEKFPPPSGFTPTTSLGEKGFDWKTIQPYLGTPGLYRFGRLGLLVFRQGLYGNRRPPALRRRFWNHPAALPFLFCPSLSRPFYERRGDHRQGHRHQYYHRRHRCSGFKMERLPSGKPLCHPGLLVGIVGGWHHIRDRNGHRRRMRKRNFVAGIRRTA